MKSLTHYIQEKLVIKKSNKKYLPETKEELRAIIEERIKDKGNEVDLNDIDVSNIKDMSYLFAHTNFNGDISKWDVSHVTNMRDMFCMCYEFNQDISGWGVSNVTNMNDMFDGCVIFNKDISNWDVSKVQTMYGMFYGCGDFNQDISKWDISNLKYTVGMFEHCKIEEKYKPKLK